MIRKSLKKNILFMASAVVIPFMAAGTYGITSQACEVEIVEDNEDVLEERGVARSPIIEYRYKIIDGELYRRLYNYSDGYWIGDWELVPLKEA